MSVNFSCLIIASVVTGGAAAVSGSVIDQTPKVEHLQEVLRKHSPQYYEIGRILGVDYGTLHAIDCDNTQYLGPEKKLDALIDKSLQKYPHKTWKEIIEGFQNENLNKQANEIKEFLQKKRIQDFYAHIH